MIVLIKKVVESSEKLLISPRQVTIRRLAIA